MTDGLTRVTRPVEVGRHEHVERELVVVREVLQEPSRLVEEPPEQDAHRDRTLRPRDDPDGPLVLIVLQPPARGEAAAQDPDDEAPAQAEAAGSQRQGDHEPEQDGLAEPRPGRSR